MSVGEPPLAMWNSIWNLTRKSSRSGCWTRRSQSSCTACYCVEAIAVSPAGLTTHRGAPRRRVFSMTRDTALPAAEQESSPGVNATPSRQSSSKFGWRLRPSRGRNRPVGKWCYTGSSYVSYLVISLTAPWRALLCTLNGFLRQRDKQ
jgi:hypothetical protein